MGVYLATVFCFGFAMMAYDNYFSYFLRDQLGFPTSVNGYFKALIGVIAIIANSTINMWINKHTDVRKSITVILAMSSVSVAMMVSFKSVLPFMASALVYYTFNAITVPVLQVMMGTGTHCGPADCRLCIWHQPALSLHAGSGGVYAGSCTEHLEPLPVQEPQAPSGNRIRISPEITTLRLRTGGLFLYAWNGRALYRFTI